MKHIGWMVLNPFQFTDNRGAHGSAFSSYQALIIILVHSPHFLAMLSHHSLFIYWEYNPRLQVHFLPIQGIGFREGRVMGRRLKRWSLPGDPQWPCGFGNPQRFHPLIHHLKIRGLKSDWELFGIDRGHCDLSPIIAISHDHFFLIFCIGLQMQPIFDLFFHDGLLFLFPTIRHPFGLLLSP